MKIRVLFADDQIPWDNPDRDDQVKKAIEDEKGNELRALGKVQLLLMRKISSGLTNCFIILNLILALK